MHVATLLRGVDIDNAFHFYDVAKFERPDEVARAVRASWQLPRGPLQNVTQAIEEAGGIVVACNFKTPLLDAMSRWYPKMPPLFFTNMDSSGDRLRFTLAHELGHLFLHSAPNPCMEDEANRFAAEFLMPAEDITASLYGLTLEKLASLKRYWKVAMSALLHRAQELGTISQRMAKRLWVQMSKAGYRTREPVELAIPIETPTLLQEIIDLYRDELRYSVSQLGQALALNDHEVRSLYLGHKASLSLVKRAKGLMISRIPNPQTAS
jgi:Zn-dependent peptidase ImmA (M78 family)